MHESQRKHLTAAASKLQRAFNQLGELERTQERLAELFPDEVEQRQDLLEIIGEQFLSVQEDMQGVEDAVGDFSRGLRQYYVGVRDEHKATQRAARARGQAVPGVVRPSPAHMTPLELFSIIDRLPDGYEFPMAAATSKGDAKAIFRRFPNYNRIDVGGVPGHDPMTYLIQDWQGNPHPPMRSVMLDGGSNYSWGNIEDVLRSVDPSAALDKHPAKAPGPPARAPKARPRAGLRLVENDLDQLEQEVAALDQPYQAPAPPPPPRSAPAPRAQVSATG